MGKCSMMLLCFSGIKAAGLTAMAEFARERAQAKKL